MRINEGERFLLDKGHTEYWTLTTGHWPLSSMNQTNHFFNLGYGWLCKHCSAADSEEKHRPSENRGGQQERAQGLALAGWTDPSRHALACPRCGIEETITGS